MNPTDPDKRLLKLIAKALIPPGGCDTSTDDIEAMLDAARAEPFSDEQIDRMLKKAKGKLPLGQLDDEPVWDEAALTEEEQSLLALHRREGGKLPEAIAEKLCLLRKKARNQPDEEGSGEQ